MKHYDAIVIGFGKGGKTLAGDLASRGQEVAVVERSAQMYGGTCINVGCIPSKSLVGSALRSKLSGGTFAEKQRAYEMAVKEKRRLVEALRQKNYDKLAQNPHCTVYTGEARFLSPHEVQVRTGTDTFAIEGERIFINTGSTPVIPPIPGIDGNPYVHVSSSLMDLDVLPRRLTIIGGGYIGLEFASMYANFGAAVTVLQDGAALVPREDRDIADAIQALLEEKGVSFRLGASVHEIGQTDSSALVHYTWQGETCADEADVVLVAAGRRPNTEHLHPEAAGVALTPRGAIAVDEKRQTSVPHIWAMGDVVGGLQFTYVSLDDYRIVRSQLDGGTYTAVTRKTVPYSVFIDPPYSRVGLNEQEAAAAGYSVKIAKMPAAAIPKAQVLRHPAGLLKAVIDADTHKILGAMLLCEESHEMINTVKLAMDMDAEYTVLRDQVFTHPTMSEALNDLFSV